jgi:hypothetical protein
LNPIEEFFAELKAFVRRNWQSYKGNPDQGFGTFVEWCVDVVGARGKRADGHFWHAGVTTESYEINFNDGLRRGFPEGKLGNHDVHR